jgi:hypothetical protein
MNPQENNKLDDNKNLTNLQKTLKRVMIAFLVPIIVLTGFIIYKLATKNSASQKINNNISIEQKLNNGVSVSTNNTNIKNILLNEGQNCNFIITYQQNYIALHSKECALLITINPQNYSVSKFSLK